MADEKLKQELLYMVRLSQKYDLSNKLIVDGIKEMEQDRQLLSSVFGTRFLGRITDLSEGRQVSHSCVICGSNEAANGVICQACTDRIAGSAYASHGAVKKTKPAEAPQINKPEQPPVQEPAVNETAVNESTSTKPAVKLPEIKVPQVKLKLPQIKLPQIKTKEQTKEKNRLGSWKFTRPQVAALILLTIWFAANMAAYIIWFNAETMFDVVVYNHIEPATVSEAEPVEIDNQADALEAVASEFPAEEGWDIKYLGYEDYPVGYFTVDKGDNVTEAIDSLTDEERYDFFFVDGCYKYIVSYKDETSAKLGVVLVNMDGKILTMGSFNNGRDTNSYYRIR